MAQHCDCQQVREALRHSEFRTDALLRLSQMTSASLGEVADFALEQAVAATESQIGYLALVNDDETVLTVHAWSRAAMAECRIADKPLVFPVENTGLWGEAVRQRRPVITNDYAAPNPLKRGTPAGHVPLTRHMNVPVFDGPRIVAVAGVANKPTEYDENDVQQLTLLMQGMWKIIQRHRAEQELRQHVEALQAAVQALSELNAVARAADAAKGQFLANVSHEIRTPLNAILGYAELLAERVAPPKDRDLLDIIRRNGEHLLTLINDLIDLSRIEAGKLQVEKTFCQPATVVADVVELMRMRAETKGLTLGIEQRVPFPATIATDPVRLRQILINLVGNAIKFTETGGVRVVLEAGHGPDGPQVRFEVIDSGIGIPAEDVAALFQPFSQVDPSTARRNQGAGLGLAISRRLAELLGGEITLHSEVGKGSSFCLTLHLNMAESDAATAHRRATDALAAAVAEAQLHGTRILLAEDAPDNQRLLKIILERAGAEVTLAEDGLAAVEQAVRARQAGTPFDAVLMDIQMPRVDGFEATRELRAAGFDQPIVALTAHATAEDRLRCLEAGCDDYVAKPIDRRALLSTLSRRLKATAKRRRPVATE